MLFLDRANGQHRYPDGVLISIRSPPQFSDWGSHLYKESETATAGLALNDRRGLAKGHLDPKSRIRRLKACMKQVLGGLFSRHKTSEWESESVVIKALVEQAEAYRPDHIKPLSDQKRLRSAAEKVMKKLRKLIGQKVRQYLEIISRRLFDHELQLKMDFFTNNCQYFCDQLLQQTPFGSFLDGDASGSLFSMSFATRPGDYAKDDVSSKWDVPFGMTEEYLLDFYSGKYNDSDIIDTLQEYWYDWGGFGRNLYQFQHLFPWDCTEAYKQMGGKCNECSLSKHVWSFPFDALSITKLHLLRRSSQYPPSSNNRGRPKRGEWHLDNRLTVLLAQDALVTVAKALSQLPSFRDACAWLQNQKNPWFDRLKLGGIHRAQPFSHHFELDSACAVAPWIHFNFGQQQHIYEYIRDLRMNAPDRDQFSYASAMKEVGDKFGIETEDDGNNSLEIVPKGSKGKRRDDDDLPPADIWVDTQYAHHIHHHEPSPPSSDRNDDDKYTHPHKYYYDEDPPITSEDFPFVGHGNASNHSLSGLSSKTRRVSHTDDDLHPNDDDYITPYSELFARTSRGYYFKNNDDDDGRRPGGRLSGHGVGGSGSSSHVYNYNSSMRAYAHGGIDGGAYCGGVDVTTTRSRSRPS